MRSSSLPCARRAAGRTGFTITELLVAATISLILTYAVVQMFDYVASEARYGRASIELAGQLRSASRRVATDLACVTAPVRPFADRHGQGYFEYVEGPGTDSVAFVYTAGGAYPTTTRGSYAAALRTSQIDATLPLVPVESSVGGDVDDILMFTAYNPDEPFRGRYTPYTYNGSAWVRGQTTTVESKYAEIAIWTVRDRNGIVKLYRRALLIRPDFTASGYYTAAAPDFPLPPSPPLVDPIRYRKQTFYQENDISVRYDGGTNTFVGNSLGDLTRRENRFAHIQSNDPYLYPIDVRELQQHDPFYDRTDVNLSPGWLLTNDATRGLYYEGNDVLLAEVLAFDVKAFDPLGSVRLDEDSFTMNPSDPGYDESAGPGGGARVSLQTGAFVDLGYDMTYGYANGTQLTGSAQTWFSGNGLSTVATDPSSKLVNLPSAYPATGPAYATVTPYTPQFVFRTYCTWSSFYEMNARAWDADGDGTLTAAEGDLNGNGQVDFLEGNEDNGRIARGGVWIADAGTNGLDDDNDGVADNLNEWDTAPPYPHPLRGVQITLRVMEPNSRQVRQMTVVQNFTGE